MRAATLEDAVAMSGVLIRSITALCGADHANDTDAIAGWLANKSPDGVRAWFANPANRLFVAEHDGALAAAGAINDQREIILNYVDPAHRFAGVSTAMLRALEAALGPGEARLTSTRTAHPFYLARGWVDDGSAGCDGGLSGVRMRKGL